MALDPIYMKRFGELLVFHRLLDNPEELTDGNFNDAVMEFQAKADILVDGIVGPETLWRLQEPWVLQAPKLIFVKCEADVVSGVDGYETLLLRADASEHYRALRQEVTELGGVITTAGGKRPLSAGSNANRSSKSMHYTGLALDLATTSGFFKPDTDPFVVTRGKDTYWNVWCRGPGGEQMELEAIYWQNWNSGKDLTKKVAGTFLDFTAACRKHGFHPIGPRSSFTRETNRKYLSAEWWHFQANHLLIPELSQFGIELLMIDSYTTNHIREENEGLWANRKAIFKKDWF